MLTITYHQYSSQTVKQSDTVRENTGYFFCPNRSAASRCSTGFEWRLSWQRLGLVFTSQGKGLLRCPNRVVLRENLETGNETKKKDLSPNLVQLSYLQKIASFNLQVTKNTTNYAGQETSLSSPRRSPRHQRWDRS